MPIATAGRQAIAGKSISSLSITRPITQAGAGGQSLDSAIRALFANGEQGAWYDPSDFSTLFQDAAGTTPVTAVEEPVGRILDKSGRGNHATQATAASRPKLTARKNLLLATTTLATQSVTCLAAQHTLSFKGTGTVTLSGASTAGPLVGTGANDSVSLTFTPSAGNVTFTVSGTVTDAQLEYGSAVTRYQRVTTDTDYDTVGFPHYLVGDGVDDFLHSSAFSGGGGCHALLLGFSANKPANWSGVGEVTQNSSNQPGLSIGRSDNTDQLWYRVDEADEINFRKGAGAAGVYAFTPSSVLFQIGSGTAPGFTENNNAPNNLHEGGLSEDTDWPGDYHVKLGAGSIIGASMNIKCYGLIYRRATSHVDYAPAREWLAEKAGVAL